MRAARNEILPISLPPMGVNREQAAALVGISASLFDKAIEAGTMPRPRVIGGRNVWDVAEISEHFRAIPHKDGAGTSSALDADGGNANPWD